MTTMAKQEGQQTMEEYLLSQLDTPVVLKDGTMMTKPDGSPMTKQEAIATNILNLAMNRRSSESRAKRRTIGSISTGRKSSLDSIITVALP